jgi:hypothetical protein
MASKGQKFRKYTPEFKRMILEEYFAGKCGCETIAKKYEVSVYSIRNWIRKVRNNIDFSVDNRGYPKGRKHGFIDYKERYEIIKKFQVFLEARRGKK